MNYNSSDFMRKARLYLLLGLLLLAACTPSQIAARDISISVRVDGRTMQLSVADGSSVAEALDIAGVQLAELDRTEPPSYTTLAAGDSVRVVRVSEDFETEQNVLPFVSRTLPNEALPVGEQRLIQNGANGLQEVTYRLLYEDGELVSRTQVSTMVLTRPVEEIIMIGAAVALQLCGHQRASGFPLRRQRLGTGRHQRYPPRRGYHRRSGRTHL